MMKSKMQNTKQKNKIMKIHWKSPKIDNEFYKKNYKSLTERKVFLIVSEFLFGSVGLGIGSGLTFSGLDPVGIMCASSISFLSSVST